MLSNFVFGICQAQPSWTPAKFIESTVQKVRETVGRAACSAPSAAEWIRVAATLVHRAIGERLTCVFVNNGVLRKDEYAKVQHNLRTKLHLNIDAVDATERFLDEARRRHRPRDASARSSATNSSRSSTKRRGASSASRATSTGWCRERSIRT